MVSKKKFFQLFPAQDVRVVLNVRVNGELFELVHLFREPTAEDKKAFWASITRTELLEGGPGGQGVDYLGANEMLYDRCILRVEGYDISPRASGESEPAADVWKEAIPLEHKLWAVEELLSRAGTLSEQASKN